MLRFSRIFQISLAVGLMEKGLFYYRGQTERKNAEKAKTEYCMANRTILS
jgi:hypothetical protein